MICRTIQKCLTGHEFLRVIALLYLLSSVCFLMCKRHEKMKPQIHAAALDQATLPCPPHWDGHYFGTPEPKKTLPPFSCFCHVFITTIRKLIQWLIRLGAALWLGLNSCAYQFCHLGTDQTYLGRGTSTRGSASIILAQRHGYEESS